MSDYPETVAGFWGEEPFQLKDIPSYGDHMTLQDWKECVECGGFIDYDGDGDFATETQCSNMSVSPSDYWTGKEQDPEWNPPSWATHIVWYNK